MALVVDRFEFLAHEVFSVFRSIRDVLAVVGALYASKRVLAVTWRVCTALKTHGISRLCRPSLVRKYGPWAVVTGCTGGIGLAYVYELAECGFNIILISRNYEKLKYNAKDLEKTFGIQTHIIPVDFNDGQVVYEKIQQGLQGKEIGILVNNVGVMYDYPKYFLDVPVEKIWQLIHVNVSAATMMTHMVLPQMVERGRGAVVTVASGASTIPTPQMTVYSATKAYLDYYMRALSHEYRSCGITFQCLMPFYVATRMTGYSSTLSNPSFLIPTATTYARNALATLGWSERTTGYWPHTLQMWASYMLPEWLWMWGASRLNNALRRQAMQRQRHRSGTKSSSSRLFPSSVSLDRFPTTSSTSSLRPGFRIGSSDRMLSPCRSLDNLKRCGSPSSVASQTGDKPADLLELNSDPES